MNDFAFADRIRRLSKEQSARLAEQLNPLSFAQERIWFLEQLEPGGTTYHLPLAARLNGPLDPTALERTFSEIYRRHDALRTCFVTIDHSPYQVITPPGPFPLGRHDLSSLPPLHQGQELQRRIAAVVREPFDFEQGPMMRAALIRLEPEDHVVVAVLHHIAADGFSIRILLREIAALYTAFARSEPPLLPDLPIQYADYARWQRGLVGTALMEQRARYWEQALADAPRASELPTDRPRPTTQTFRGETVTRRIEPQASNSFKQFMAAESATPFMGALAALAIVLSRCSGQQDVLIGTPIAGRVRPETEDLIGCFLNTLVLRLSVHGATSFRDLLRLTRQMCLGAYEHQDLPFEHLLQLHRPERNLSRTPLFQVMLNDQHFEPAPVELPDLSITPMSVGLSADAKFDATIYLQHPQDEMLLKLVYNADLFERSTARWFLDHILTVMTQGNAAPDRPSWEIRLLDPTHCRGPTPPVLVTEDERVGGMSSQARTPADRFDEVARTVPDAPALITSERTWSYRQLAAVADQTARRLLAAGLDRADRVALLIADPALAVGAILGVGRAGGVYVVLDPSHPKLRLKVMAKDAEPLVGLTDQEPAVASGIAPLRWLTMADHGPAAAETLDALPPGDPQAPAYLLYTSGSTDRPKGVVQSQQNVLHHASVYANRLGICPGDRLTLLASLGFDAAVMDVFGALLHGATLCPLDVLATAVDELAERIRKLQITVYHSTPSVFRYISEVAQRDHFQSVRAVVLGGEEALRTDLERFRRLTPPSAVLVNGLGPTESTLGLQFFADHHTRLPGQYLPVGGPVEGSEVALLGPDGEDAELFGEIALCSRHVALGYWRRPAETAARFCPDPEHPDRRAYHTGDFGRRLPDGSILFIGRKDDQVQIGGVRVDLGEVRGVLGEAPGVGDCLVLAEREPRGPTLLKAYVIPAGNRPLRQSSLREYLKERLPRSSIPASIVLLDQFPLTPHGKPDREALSKVTVREQREVELAPPSNAREEMVAKLFAELLNVRRVGRKDSFFGLGGHSLLAIRLVARIGEELDVMLPLRTIFEHPTVGELAAAIAKRAEQATREETLPAIPARNRRSITELLDDIDG